MASRRILFNYNGYPHGADILGVNCEENTMKLMLPGMLDECEGRPRETDIKLPESIKADALEKLSKCQDDETLRAVLKNNRSDLPNIKINAGFVDIRQTDFRIG